MTELLCVEYAENMVEMGEKADRAREAGAEKVISQWDKRAKVYIIEYEIPKVE